MHVYVSIHAYRNFRRAAAANYDTHNNLKTQAPLAHSLTHTNMLDGNFIEAINQHQLKCVAGVSDNKSSIA